MEKLLTPPILYVFLGAMFLVGVTFLMAFNGLLMRIRKGKFAELPHDDKHVHAFSTNMAIFVIDGKVNGVQVEPVKGEKLLLQFVDIKGISYSYHEKSTWATEYLLGLDIFDFFGYKDTVDWYHIALVLQDDNEIPLFLAGQYERREFGEMWFIHLNKVLLAKMNLYRNVDDYSREVLDRIQGAFKAVGHPMQLVV